MPVQRSPEKTQKTGLREAEPLPLLPLGPFAGEGGQCSPDPEFCELLEEISQTRGWGCGNPNPHGPWPESTVGEQSWKLSLPAGSDSR
jgi:hypothetical protein